MSIICVFLGGPWDEKVRAYHSPLEIIEVMEEPPECKLPISYQDSEEVYNLTYKKHRYFLWKITESHFVYREESISHHECFVKLLDHFVSKNEDFNGQRQSNMRVRVTRNGEITYNRLTDMYEVWDETYASIICESPYAAIADLAYQWYGQTLSNYTAMR